MSCLGNCYICDIQCDLGLPRLLTLLSFSFRRSYAVHAKCGVGKFSACQHHAYGLTVLKELVAAIFEVWCGESCTKSPIKALNSRRSSPSLLSGTTRILHIFSHSTPTCTANNHWWLGWPPRESLHSQCGFSKIIVIDFIMTSRSNVIVYAWPTSSMAPCKELLHKFIVCYWLIDHWMTIYGGQFLWRKSCGWDKACIRRQRLDATAAYVTTSGEYQIHLYTWFTATLFSWGSNWLELYQPVLVWVAQPQLQHLTLELDTWISA